MKLFNMLDWMGRWMDGWMGFVHKEGSFFHHHPHLAQLRTRDLNKVSLEKDASLTSL